MRSFGKCRCRARPARSRHCGYEMAGVEGFGVDLERNSEARGLAFRRPRRALSASASQAVERGAGDGERSGRVLEGATESFYRLGVHVNARSPSVLIVLIRAVRGGLGIQCSA